MSPIRCSTTDAVTQTRGTGRGGQDGAVPRFLVVSLVASVVLTVLVNAVLWMFPGVGQRIGEMLRRAAERTMPPSDKAGRSAVRVVFPWKLMLIGSLLVTVLLNLLLLLTR